MNNSTTTTTKASPAPANNAKTTGNGAGPAIVRKSNPTDLLKSLKSVDKSSVKKPTILDQAARDWNKCKVEENLEEELKQATKSKSGYLERQNFLQRSDLRQFEREREIRDRTRAAAHKRA